VAFSPEYLLAGLAAFAAALVSSCAGFGGALLLLPALTAMFGLQRALPILACAQLVGNFSRALFGLSHLNRKIIMAFAAGLVPAGLLATLYLTQVAESTVRVVVATIVCAAALFEAAEVFALMPSALKPLRPPEEPRLWFTAAGGLVGVISALGGTAGPLPNAFFLRLQLVPAAYVANEAAAMGLLHLAKLIAFGMGSWAHTSDISLMVFISVVMVCGTYAGKLLLPLIPVGRYRKALALWMIAAAVSLYFIATE